MLCPEARAFLVLLLLPDKNRGVFVLLTCAASQVRFFLMSISNATMPLTFASLSLRELSLPFLICGKEVWSFGRVQEEGEKRRAELEKQAGRFLGSFTALALRARPDPQTIADLFACFDQGQTVLLLHPRLSKTEQESVLSAFPAVVRLGADCFGIEAQNLKSGAGEPQSNLEHILAILPTSGSTGSPKLVCLSRRAFVASFAAHSLNFSWQTGDRWLLCMPFAHIGGLSVLTRCFLARVPVVLYQGGSFSAKEFWRSVKRNRVTLASLVPTMLARLVEEGSCPPPCLRLALLGGGPCPARLWRQAAKLGWPLAVTYGMTETCSQIATDRLGGKIGKLFVLPRVQIATREQEIRVKGDMLFSGYWRDGGCVSGLDADGWFTTRDIGFVLPDGEIRLQGRKQDMIISGGENIFPLEVEKQLDQLTQVRRSCVFAVKHPEWGEAVAAAIMTDSPRDEVLQAITQMDMAGFKKPKFVAFCAPKDDWPTKINRKKLAQELRDKLEPVKIVR